MSAITVGRVLRFLKVLRMKPMLPVLAAVVMLPCSANLHAEAPVASAKDAEALFTSPDPKLNANKQVVYHIVKDLVEAGHWELASKYVADDYVQHNPLIQSGRDNLAKHFMQLQGGKSKPIPEKLQMPVVSVVAEGDLVIVAFPYEVKDPKNPSKTYTTTWFDMWRIKDGKAAEHWDVAMKNK